jgi:hypothetical protein
MKFELDFLEDAKRLDRIDKIYRIETGGPMLGLANQSPSVAASELARR